MSSWCRGYVASSQMSVFFYHISFIMHFDIYLSIAFGETREYSRLSSQPWLLQSWLAGRFFASPLGGGLVWDICKERSEVSSSLFCRLHPQSQFCFSASGIYALTFGLLGLLPAPKVHRSWPLRSSCGLMVRHFLSSIEHPDSLGINLSVFMLYSLWCTYSWSVSFCSYLGP